MTPEQALTFARAHARGEHPESCQWYLDGREFDDDGSDYCGGCVRAAPLITAFIGTWLRWLLGDPFDSALMEESEEILDNNIRGGYLDSADGPQFCEICTTELRFSPTNYACEEDLKAWARGDYDPAGPWEWHLAAQAIETLIRQPDDICKYGPKEKREAEVAQLWAGVYAMVARAQAEESAPLQGQPV